MNGQILNIILNEKRKGFKEILRECINLKCNLPVLFSSSFFLCPAICCGLRVTCYKKELLPINNSQHATRNPQHLRDRQTSLKRRIMVSVKCRCRVKIAPPKVIPAFTLLNKAPCKGSDRYLSIFP
jgi:hypothetical protein